MFENHEESKEHRHSIVSEVGPVALFALCVNLCRRLNIPPQDFNELLNDVEGAHVYLEEIMLAKMKSAIDKRREKVKENDVS